MSTGFVPVRTCVGCRQRAPRSDLVRLVQDRAAAAAVVIVDPVASAPGRGCWVHLHSGCLDRAVQRRTISRALRLPEPVHLTDVLEWFAQHQPLIQSNRERVDTLWEPDESPPMSTNH